MKNENPDPRARTCLPAREDWNGVLDKARYHRPVSMSSTANLVVVSSHLADRVSAHEALTVDGFQSDHHPSETTFLWLQSAPSQSTVFGNEHAESVSRQQSKQCRQSLAHHHWTMRPTSTNSRASGLMACAQLSIITFQPFHCISTRRCFNTSQRSCRTRSTLWNVGGGYTGGRRARRPSWHGRIGARILDSNAPPRKLQDSELWLE